MPVVAAIDVGSNATRLCLAEVSATGRELGESYVRYPIRLGADVFAKGKVSRANGDALVAAFSDIALRLDAQGIERYRAVATSAMRDAKNAEVWVRRIRRQTGLALEVISGAEEGRLSREALMRALGSVDGSTLLLDLGGGSLELEDADGAHSRSWPLGTQRVLARFPELAGPVSEARVREIRTTLRRSIGARFRGRSRRASLAVGTGGNLDVLARALPLGRGFWPVIDMPRLPAFALGLAQLTLDERREQLGLRQDRAELLLPTALVLWALSESVRLEALVVPGTGLREEISHRLAERSSVHDQARAVAARLGLGVDRLDARARLARELFRALAPIHRLWGPALAVLDVTSYLADAGALIDPVYSVDHTAYVFRHVVPLELDERGRRVAAYAVAWAEGGLLPEDTEQLAAEDLPTARLLGALTQVARELADTAPNASVSVDLLASPITLHVGARAAIDGRTLARLERVLGVRIEVG